MTLEFAALLPRPLRDIVAAEGDLAELPRPARELVETYRRDVAPRDSGSPRTVDDVLASCDVVAAPLGRLLTGLFAWHSGPVAAVLPALDSHAVAFGRVLRLHDILQATPRDVLADCGGRGVRRRMIAVAQREVAGAVAYLDALPASEVAIRRFCTAHLLVAVLTMRKLWSGDSRPVSRRMVRTATRLAGPATSAAVLAALRQPLPTAIPRTAFPEIQVDDAIKAAANRLVALQSPSGSWHMDYGSMPVFLALYVITYYVTDTMPPEHARMAHHFRVRQNSDGGWGMDVESDSTVLVTVLGYTAMRLLGVPADDPCLLRARACFERHGGPLAMPHWGRIFLAVLGVFDWRGLYPFIPELWLLPRRLPVHPGRMWCFARVVFSSMSWLYAHRSTVADDPLLRELRHELYTTDYDRIDWARSRAKIADTDAYRRRSWLLRAVFGVLSVYDARPSRTLRARAVAVVLDQVEHENRSSNFVGHGPIPKVLDTLVWHFARPGGEEVAAHVKRLPDYLWDHPRDGMRVQSFNSSETWDTSFAVQALVASRQTGVTESLRSAAGFLERNQRLTPVPDAERHYRHHGVGGWTLSTVEQGWTISDGTAEALKALFALDGLGLAHEVTPERRRTAAEFLLSLQNTDGGWPAYEKARAPAWLEKFNFSDLFDNLMIDYSTVEPTASCVTALRRHGSGSEAIRRGEEYLLRQQRADGSWEGFWGVCFTYGTWFGVKGLKGSTHPGAAAAVDRACEFLLAHQRDDGGWGERIDANRNGRYIHAASQAVMTSWALLALADAGRAASPAARRAAAFLVRAQQPDGGWEDQHLSGAMMRCAAMNYDIYRYAFPLWALSVFAEESA